MVHWAHGSVVCADAQSFFSKRTPNQRTGSHRWIRGTSLLFLHVLGYNSVCNVSGKRIAPLIGWRSKLAKLHQQKSFHQHRPNGPMKYQPWSHRRQCRLKCLQDHIHQYALFFSTCFCLHAAGDHGAAGISSSALAEPPAKVSGEGTAASTRLFIAIDRLNLQSVSVNNSMAAGLWPLNWGPLIRNWNETNSPQP